VQKVLAVASDRLTWQDVSRADGTEDFRAVHVLHATVGPEHDVLAGLDAHATGRTAG